MDLNISVKAHDKQDTCYASYRFSEALQTRSCCFFTERDILFISSVLMDKSRSKHTDITTAHCYNKRCIDDCFCTMIIFPFTQYPMSITMLSSGEDNRSFPSCNVLVQEPLATTKKIIQHHSIINNYTVESRPAEFKGRCQVFVRKRNVVSTIQIVVAYYLPKDNH